MWLHKQRGTNEMKKVDRQELDKRLEETVEYI